MKSKFSIVLPFLILIVNLFSCKKDFTKRVAIPNSSPSNAYLKVIHAAPGFSQVFNAPDNFNVLVGGINGLRMVTGMTYNSAFPSNTLNNNTYAAVPSGSQDIRLLLKGSTNTDSLTVAIIPKNMDPGNYYTLVLTDSITTTSDYSKIWTQDVIPTTPAGSVLLRFIHAVMNDTAGKKIDVYSARAAANIFAAVSPGTAAGFITIPYTNTLDTIIIRRAGSTFELARINGVIYANSQRAYTLIYRGNGDLTTGTKARGAFIYNNK